MRIGLLVVPVIVLACGSGSDSGESSSSAFIEQYCSELTPCCGPTGSDGKQPGSGCVTIHSFFAGAAAFDGAAGTACLNEIRAGKSDPAFCSKVSSLTPSCNNVFKATASQTGTAQPGAECSTDRDCAPSTEGEVSCTFDRSQAGSSKMVCQVEMVGKPGDAPCMGTKSGSLTSYVSGAPAKAYVCDAATSYCSKATKKCEAIKAVGADCGASSESYECGERAKANCDYSTKKCIALKADGEACSTSSECASSSCMNNACKAPSSSGTDVSLILVCSTAE